MDQDFCDACKPGQTWRMCAKCQLLTAAHMRGANQMKAHAVAYFKGHAAAVMQSDAWTELLKNSELVNAVVAHHCKV
jgi:hypothetical protein